MKALIFDTETTDMVKWKLPPEHASQPHLVQLAMLLVETGGWEVKARHAMLVRLDADVAIEAGAREAHGISEEDCRNFGVAPVVACSLFNQLCLQADAIVAHNMSFDRSIMLTALHRLGGKPDRMEGKRLICTKEATTEVLRLPGKYGKYKWPTLAEAYRHYTGLEIEGAHDALVDAEACLAVFRALTENGVVEA
ncbi:MAG: 3'-5' exonuclease [Deltaproteobacteria bacterium]|nr:3'-5' exonuclease [Deltaproteobacteria bacterium]MBW2417988.1 3'-5' exonuclease [Deltaproteobacteria bacterium]